MSAQAIKMALILPTTEQETADACGGGEKDDEDSWSGRLPLARLMSCLCDDLILFLVFRIPGDERILRFVHGDSVQQQ